MKQCDSWTPMKEINDYHSLIMQQILTQGVPLTVAVSEVPCISVHSTWSQLSNFVQRYDGDFVFLWCNAGNWHLPNLD